MSRKWVKTTPSLKPELINPEWLDGVWADAVILAIRETGISDFSDSCPWSMDDVLSVDWLPENFR
jgi:Domain of unknown function DUF29